jgi:hypothetical protein
MLVSDRVRHPILTTHEWGTLDGNEFGRGNDICSPGYRQGRAAGRRPDQCVQPYCCILPLDVPWRLICKLAKYLKDLGSHEPCGEECPVAVTPFAVVLSYS